MRKNMGASANADPATRATPRAPAGLGHTAGIRSAVERALAPLKSWSVSRFCGSPAEKLIWLQYHQAAPEAIIEALHKAGYAIVPMGGRLPTSLWADDDELRYRTRYRAQMEVEPMVIGAEQDVPSDMAADPDFRRNHLPRVLARTMLRVFEERVGEQLAQAIEARSDETA